MTDDIESVLEHIVKHPLDVNGMNQDGEYEYIFLPVSKLRKITTPGQLIELLCDLYHSRAPIEAARFAEEMKIMREQQRSRAEALKLQGSIPPFIYYGAELAMKTITDTDVSFWTEKNTRLFFKMYRVGSAETHGVQR